MANNGGRRSSSAPGNSSSLILGILIGMVVGLAVAGGVAWHLSTRPSAFTSKEQKEQHDSQAAAPAAPVAPVQKQPVASTQPSSTAASGVANGKQHFTFYEILTDKDSSTSKGSGHTTPAPKDNAKTPTATAYFLQAGSFSNSDDANKLKVKLALLGMESSVQTADVPGKGTYYRVRLGPYHSTDELNKAKDTLKQNGISNTAQVRAQ